MKHTCRLLNALPGETHTLQSGETLTVQLAPYGSYSAIDSEGREVDQDCSRENFEALCKAFSAEVLVDYEHNSETGGSTEAAAWLTQIWVDDSLGLMGNFRLTDRGAEALREKRYRFLSPCWSIDSDGRFIELLSVALTNKPNLPVRALLNRTQQQTFNVEEKDTLMKEQLITLLGLPPETSEEDIVAAVQTLKTENDSYADAALNEEAEEAAEENKELIANREAFVKLYISNREAAKNLLATLKAPAKQPVCNRLAAKRPEGLIREADLSDAQIANRWKGMTPGAEKDAFLVSNKEAIQRALTPQQN